VVAPDENKSGSGGKTTPGTLRRQPTTTLGGYPATAVTGFPADTVRVALDDLGVRPQLVIAGVNEGQNVGPIASISGTIGAARAAAQRGIPGLGVSQGTPEDSTSYDYDVGADYAVQEVQKLLPTLSGTPDVSTIVSINIPSCDAGQVRGLRELPPTPVASGRLLEASDCTSTAEPTDEGEAFLAGFAVLTRLPARA
jgi:5'-nucleotidase